MAYCGIISTDLERELDELRKQLHAFGVETSGATPMESGQLHHEINLAKAELYRQRQSLGASLTQELGSLRTQRAYFTGMLGNDIPVTFDQLRAEITTTRNELHKYQQVLMTRLFDKPREEALAYYNQYYIHITRPDTLMDTL